MGAQGQGESQTGSWTLAEEGQMLGGAAFLTGLMQEVNTHGSQLRATWAGFFTFTDPGDPQNA